MKYTKLILTLAVFSAVSNLAFADGNAFTPLNFDDATSTPVAVSKPVAAPVKASNSNPIANIFSRKPAPAIDTAPDAASGVASGEVPVGNDNIQNAILQLDNAQVGIRNDLVNYKAKYADADAQFKLVKNERAVLHKQVVTIERRIKLLDKTKEGLRRNML